MTKRFELWINTENDAFKPDALPEIARILRETADKMESGADDFSFFRTLRDVNGNDVGRAKLHNA